MKMKSIFVIIILFILLCPGASHSRDNKPGYGAEIGTWRHSLTGTLNFFNPGFDFSTNLETNGNFTRNSNFSGAYTQKLGNLSDICVSANLTRNAGVINAYGVNSVSVNNVVFGAGGYAVINTELNSDIIDIMGLRELASGPNGYINFAYGIRLGRIALNLSDANFIASNSFTRNIALPFIGFDGTCNITDTMYFYGKYIGTNVDTGSGSSTRNYIVNELDAGIEYHLLRRAPEYIEIGPGLPSPKDQKDADNFDWYLQLGYKEQYMKETEKQNRMVMRNSGPQFKIIIRH